MRKDAFRTWLGRRVYQGRRLTAKGIANRVGKLPRIERALADLGFEERDLDSLHANGRWPQLLAALGTISADWRRNEAAARRMAPQADDPSRQLGNLPNVARQYGHFADGKDPNYDVEGDGDDREIDEDALAALRARFIAAFPDFESGGGFAGASSYHGTEDYKRPLIASVQALLARRPTAETLGGALLGLVLDDEKMNLIGDYRRKGHLRAVRARSGGRFETAVGVLALSEADPPEAAVAFVAAAWPLVLEGSEHSKPFADIRVLATLFPALARPDRAIAVSYTRFHNLCTALLGRAPFDDNVLTAAEYRAILDLSGELFAVMAGWGWEPRDLWDVQGFVWATCGEKLDMDLDSDADRIRQYALDNYIAPARAKGEPVARIRAGDVHNALGLANAHANVCQALRGGKFQKLAGVGVPSFTGPDNSSTTTFSYVLEPGSSAQGTHVIMDAPTNLILYGPPGTGKTYATTAEAVRLCDGLPADDPLLIDWSRRGELRARYEKLADAGQIRLVTFHQSYSYEDFVEGLRPVTDSGVEGGDPVPGAGFRLEPKRGIFREICAVAENARKHAGQIGGFDLAGRKLFKMSLGRAGVEDHIFDAAVEGGYVVLGWGGNVDWSDPRYEQWSAVLERWQQEDPAATGYDPNVVQMWPFRSAMRTGDLVIVSAGNGQFRAIGEVTGPYRFEPTETRDYNHRRQVRWLLVPDEPLPVEMIYGKRFMMQSCYQLRDALVNKEALSRLLPGASHDGDGGPAQFVLIIDEINRANVSRVFGELITLIEPDKRLGGGSEALMVRLPYSGDPFGVPANLYIVGTMNTADRSIALLDTALRRRFVFREVAPDPALLPVDLDGVPIRAVLAAINDRIEYLIDREHRVGHAFFLGCGGRAEVDAVMRDKVIPLLQEYFFEDWGRVAAVLGEPAGKGGGFLDCRSIDDPTGEGGEPRLSWSVRAVFAADAYARLIGRAAAADPPETDA